MKNKINYLRIEFTSNQSEENNYISFNADARGKIGMEVAFAEE